MKNTMSLISRTIMSEVTKGRPDDLDSLNECCEE